jgi:hypothetical protein
VSCSCRWVLCVPAAWSGDLHGEATRCCYCCWWLAGWRAGSLTFSSCIVSSAMRPLLGRPRRMESLGIGLGSLVTATARAGTNARQLVASGAAPGLPAPAWHAPVCTSSPRLIRLHVTCAAPRFNWAREPAAAALGHGSTAAVGTLRAPAAGSARRTRLSCCLWHWASLYCCCSIVFALAAARWNQQQGYARKETHCVRCFTDGCDCVIETAVALNETHLCCLSRSHNITLANRQLKPSQTDAPASHLDKQSLPGPNAGPAGSPSQQRESWDLWALSLQATQKQLKSTQKTTFPGQYHSSSHYTSPDAGGPTTHPCDGGSSSSKFVRSCDVRLGVVLWPVLDSIAIGSWRASSHSPAGAWHQTPLC